MALRFANQLFEPVWNNNYVDHVQITMAEDIGIGGRAGYFDGIGIARDVIQNHLLQLLALDGDGRTQRRSRPASCEPRSRRCLLRPGHRVRMDLHTARGQYAGGWAGGEKVKGYLEEERIPPDLDGPRRTRQSASTSRTAVGPACRSIYGPGNAWPGG